MTRTRYLTLALFLLILALAAFVRLYRLDSIPAGLHGDEAHAGIVAQQILEDGWIGPYVNVALGQPAGTVYLIALDFKLLGPGVFALRLAPALLGIAAVALMFFLGRRLFGTRAGLLAAALLALSYWHIHFSRIAHPVVSLPVIEIASLYFLFRGLPSLKAGGLSTKRVWPFFVGGAFLGLSAYTYHAFPLFVAAVALLALYVLARRWRRPPSNAIGGWQFYAPRFLFLFAAALLVALPFISFVTQRGIPERFRTTSVFQDSRYQQLDTTAGKAGFLLEKAARAGKSLLTGGKIDGVDALGGRGLLDPLTAALFLGGVALALWRVRDERYLLLLLGVALGFMGSLLSSENEGQYRRAIATLPFIILAAAAFGDALAQRFAAAVAALVRAEFGLAARRGAPAQATAGVPPSASHARPAPARVRGQAFAAGFLVACLALVGYWNLNYYFRVLTPSPTARWVFAEDLAEAIGYLKTTEPGTYVYFYSARWSWNYETRRFLLPGMKGEDRSREFGRDTLERDRPGPVVYLLLPPYDTRMPEIESRNPGGQPHEYRDADGRLVFRAYSLAPTR